MVCPGCGHATSTDIGRCTTCGAPLPHAPGATPVGTIDVAGVEPDATIAPAAGQSTYQPADAFDATYLPGDAGTGDAGAGTAATGTGDLGASVARSAGPLQVGQSFGPRYRIIKLLGAGGMGAVYQAWDAELSVAVALKVIRTARRRRAASIEEERRFKNELLLARQVTHKNVVRIHDLGELDGVKYISMPYVQGDDLGAVLRQGKLPIARALRLARQIAGGLEAAHDAGVVHRDLKPPNIMIGGSGDDEVALIMDFGISASTDTVTEGSIVGTLEYMSPEQGSGQAVDARSDLYAFGVILYEMLTGLRGEQAKTAQERITAMRKRFDEGMAPLRTLDQTIPEPLAALVMRCLERDPAARFQKTADLVAALAALDETGARIPLPPRISRRTLILVGLLAATLIGGTYTVARRASRPPVAHDPVSVLIADFENRSGDPALQASLEQALGIGVEGAAFITTYPRDAAKRLAATQVGPGATLTEPVARLLSGREGINVILAGSIDPKGSGYAITVRAVDAANGRTLATAAASSADKAGVLKAMGSVASRLRTALGDTTPESTKRAAIETFTAGSLAAAQDFSTGQDLASSGKDEEAIALYKRALGSDPRFGRAYTSWAVSAFKLGRRDESAEAYKKAMALTDRMTDREKYRTFGVYYLQVARNYPKALENYTALVQAYPNDRAGHSNLALAQFYLRNFPKALEEGRLAVDQYPTYQTFRNNYALYAMYAGDFTSAAKEARRTLQENPTFAKAYLEVAIAALAAGDAAAASAAYDKMRQAGRGGASLAATGNADIALYGGRSADARQGLEAAIPVDLSAGNVYGAAMKYVALAEAYAMEDNAKRSLAAAQQALSISRDVNVAAAAARVMVTAGRISEAKTIADRLGQELEAEPRAYAKVIEGEIALRQRRTSDAVTALIDSQKIVDLWIARFDLGRAYEEAEHHAEALAELDRALKRRGEATALFLDDIPTFRYLATLPYWLARAQQGLGQTQAAAVNYQAFLAQRPTATDPVTADARRRSRP